MAEQVESLIRNPLTLVTIPSSGTSITPGIDLGNARLAFITMPAAWTAAALTFQHSPTTIDGTYFDLYLNGVEYNVPASTSRTLIIPYGEFIGLRFIKIRSGTTGTPVQQAGDRILQLGTAA